MISYFNAHTDAERWTGEITILGKRYLAKFSARRMKPSCMRCHGDPSDAPASLLAQYGSVAGFHRPLGEVIGLDTVAIPVADIESSLMRQSFRTYIDSAVGIVLFFSLITLILRFFVTKRLTDITRHFVDSAHQTDVSLLEPIAVGSADEIGELASSFNTLSSRLKELYVSLESKVTERTAELEKANETLRLEIEERRKARHDLQLTQFAIDHFSDPAFWMGPDARIIDANEAACEKLGYTRQELLRMTVHDIDPVFTREIWPRHWEELKQRQAMTIESKHRTKDGRMFPVEIKINFFAFGGHEYNFAFARDMSNQKAADQEKAALEKRLQRAHKMEALGSLAGGVAHDLNNILSGIVSYPELLLLELPENSPLHQPLITVKKSGEKAARIVQDLLTLARRGVAITEVVNVNRIIREYLDSPEFAKLKAYHPHIRITAHLGENLLNIMGSPVHLSKTIMNLVSNAAEAMPEEGEITIVTKNQYVDEPVRGYDEIAEGDYVIISIADPGIGIL